LKRLFKKTIRFLLLRGPVQTNRCTYQYILKMVYSSTTIPKNAQKGSVKSSYTH